MTCLFYITFHELTWPVDHHIMGFLEEKPWHPTESIVVSVSPGGGENLILVQKKKKKKRARAQILYSQNKSITWKTAYKGVPVNVMACKRS